MNEVWYMKYDVFISYSSKDQKVVEGLCAYLEQHKICCFVSYRDIPHGVVWAKAIVDALEESRMMLVVFSENFNNSDQVDREIEIASEEKKPILTFRIADEAFKGAKKYYLKNLNWIDAFPHPEKTFGYVVENISALLGMECQIVKQATKQEKESVTPTKPFVQTQVTLRTYKVGDYYDEGNKNRGVVFEVSEDGRHGKIVSLNEEYLKWCTEEQFDKYILVGANSDTDGKINTDIVKQRSDFEEYSPFKWCRNQGKKWYLPSQEELRAIFSVLNLVNKTLLSKQSVEIKREWYWSSTEEDESRAWSVNMDIGIGNGLACSDEKGEYQYVRAVATF